MRLPVSTRVVRCGIELCNVGEIALTLLRARRRVCSRGESGKLLSVVMTLSVKSMQSWSYGHRISMDYSLCKSMDRMTVEKANSLAQHRGFLWRVFCAL